MTLPIADFKRDEALKTWASQHGPSFTDEVFAMLDELQARNARDSNANNLGGRNSTLNHQPAGRALWETTLFEHDTTFFHTSPRPLLESSDAESAMPKIRQPTVRDSVISRRRDRTNAVNRLEVSTARIEKRLRLVTPIARAAAASGPLGTLVKALALPITLEASYQADRHRRILHAASDAMNACAFDASR